eukprot:CAMPEP_0195107174 /NCGR_PEP_ID=MMETSP0448-20130528/81927_1 /TAXON_ID=66468 /ORGANISM="Heterocapsa triquestra, Strain CCMP 448" /LENGTH=382 /DNA_ID=CAMNT_0040143583 /DNA_START=77 /DNA_END=1225 /DNA_ORIENTATION=-
MRRLIAACLCFGALPTWAWLDFGHLLAAQIAELELEQKDVTLLNTVLSDWRQDYPAMSDLVMSAVWADHIKCNAGRGDRFCMGRPNDALNAFDNWHYTDIPYNPDNLHITESRFPPRPSAVWALAEAISTFRYTKTSFACNMMLRFAIHIIGDMHQPLHCATLFSEGGRLGNFSGGDRGGNLFRIKPPSTPPGDETGHWKSLHELWDAGAGLYVYEWPLSGAEKAELLRRAGEAKQEFPREHFPQYNSSELKHCGTDPSYCIGVFERWAREGHELAISHAYAYGIHEGYDQAPSQQYLDMVKVQSERQVVLAGYRLADFLKEITPHLTIPHPSPSATVVMEDTGLSMMRILLSLACLLQSIAIAALSVVVCRRKSRDVLLQH